MINLIVVLATINMPLYENDFTTRVSSDTPPGEAWAVFKYTPGSQVAHNYLRKSLDRDSNEQYTRPYSGEAQDGWTKAIGYSLEQNHVCAVVTTDSDPALALTHKDVIINGVTSSATSHRSAVIHPLRNVFKTGKLKSQFDIRQPSSYVGTAYCWFRLQCENDVKVNNGDNVYFPCELGITSGNLAGAWRESGAAEGARSYFTLPAVTSLHWYRYYITYDLESETFEFDVYDLGLDRISMDEKPATPSMVSKSGCFRYSLAKAGGISGIFIHLNGQGTDGFYGEETYDDGKAFKVDNIKVAWQKPGTENYVECYRNDFAKSERRTIDGSSQLSHEYIQETVADTLSFKYRSDFVRSVTDSTKNGTPHLTPIYDDSDKLSKPQLVGVDGWRLAGDRDFRSCYPVVTTNKANQMLYCSHLAMAKQLMCQPITEGKVKFEIDQRMPLGWTATARCDIGLMSEKAYEKGISNASDPQFRFGLASSGAKGDVSKIEKSYGINVGATIKSDASAKLKALTWYRLQVVADLALRKASLYVYEIGENSPNKPEDFDSTNIGNAIASYENFDFASGSSDVRGVDIAAWSFTNYLISEKDVKDAEGNTVEAENVRFLVDNVRLWKAKGENWELVFKNDFTTSTRNYTCKSLDLTPSRYIDRPEYGEDGWAACPTHNASVRVTGDDSVIQLADKSISVVHPLGRNIKSGHLSAQYDVRLPAYWTYDRLQFEFGGATLASASTMASGTAKFNGHSAIRTGFGKGGYSSGSGRTYSKTVAWYDRGSSQGGERTVPFTYTYGQEYAFNAHWIRVRIEADVGAKRFNVAYYDMGVDHPEASTADGTLLTSYEGADFKYSDEPISHFWIFGGMYWSYAPWRNDAPGTMLIDNIRVYHIKPGLIIRLK